MDKICLEEFSCNLNTFLKKYALLMFDPSGAEYRKNFREFDSLSQKLFEEHAHKSDD